ncbi:TetR/AcrR family transcriptional regulator C-terminal domain-containing protein [Rhizobiales bacterium]|uniref:TetR/AcrR family transcriptional regulator C-terminal domain-containing protein n=1 Tax=Hongsoonwoonella zoysiae TaxID=2821844 RepID=UPI001560689A|nr:TetR/AcrR family transcriptional regulator C-terminal domain-containing protein [Hongsoonwoonella zoysiae]NRG17897.1 TetR/AcrR family transcriptional regulator C-terminal domain-containing protein [Hongsoonwoonella zoysiae]
MKTHGAFTPRQREVLAVALKLLVEGGDKALTTAGLARAANCSKESLYKWFGDRDGLLAGVVAYQASKVRIADDLAAQGADAFRGQLETFAEDLLTVLAGETSLALNRLAISHAGRDGAPLGRLLLERGRLPIGQRARALLEFGHRHRYLAFDDVEAAYQALYGLIVGDLHGRLLLGDRLSDEETDFPARAREAVGQFYRLFGAGA